MKKSTRMLAVVFGLAACMALFAGSAGAQCGYPVVCTPAPVFCFPPPPPPPIFCGPPAPMVVAPCPPPVVVCAPVVRVQVITPWCCW